MPKTRIEIPRQEKVDELVAAAERDDESDDAAGDDDDGDERDENDHGMYPHYKLFDP